jgi:sulfate permease, SulP family
VADLLSRPVLVGYLAGVALIMIVDQLPKLTGVPAGGDGFFGQVGFFVSHLGEANPGTVAVASAALLFLILVDRFVPKAPGPLLAVALATAAVVAFHLKSHGIAVIGEIPAGLPGFSPPSLDAFDRLLVPALGVLLVAYTDVILTGRAFEKADREDLDAGRELLALGAANVGSSLLQGFPVSSSASRTALASSAGARSQVYSLAAGAGIVGVMLFLGPLLSSVPSALLGALVVYAAAKLIDVRGFRRLAAFRYRELLLALACLAGVLALDILYGVLVAAGLSVAELLARVARPHDAILGLVSGMAGMHDVDDYPQARIIPGLLVYRYDSQLFFANAQEDQVRLPDVLHAAERRGLPRRPGSRGLSRAAWGVL